VLISLFLVPFGYLANAEEKAPVTVYMFHGSTCPHCKDGIAFFKKLLGNSEFEGMFQVRTIEVWENQNNDGLCGFEVHVRDPQGNHVAGSEFLFPLVVLGGEIPGPVHDLVKVVFHRFGFLSL